MTRVLHITRQQFPGRPLFDAAVSRAVLQDVAAGRTPETLRLFIPDRIVAFGRRDTTRPGYRAATSAARGRGFAPVERLAGGRAAVFTERTLAFAWAIPETRPADTIHDRFRELAGIVVDALQGLGLDARIGEVPGEYCPGDYSVNHGGRRKVMGVGQRLVAGAAHVGGVIVVDRPDLINEVLEPVYGHLGYQWDPAASGAVADVVAAGVETVAEAILESVAARIETAQALLDAGTLALAEQLEADAGRGRARRASIR